MGNQHGEQKKIPRSINISQPLDALLCNPKYTPDGASTLIEAVMWAYFKSINENRTKEKQIKKEVSDVINNELKTGGET